MIESFGNRRLERFWAEDDRKGIPPEIIGALRDKLHMIAFAEALQDLRVPPSNHLKMLKGDLTGKYSIRVNRQWRLVFEWEGRAARNIRLTDYH